jgi:RND family efflux transporter MFP subunit
MEQNQLKPQKPKHRWLLFLAVSSILFVLFLWGWIPHMINKKKIDALAAENPLPRVVLMQIQPNTKPIELVLPSSAQAWHITPIWSRVNGYLIRYLVDIGDVVRQGDLLAEIDTPETDQQVAQAKADLQNAIAERDIAKITSDRWQRLWNKNSEAVSKQEVDQYNANYKAAEALVIANEKNVDKTIYQQQFKYIYAPFNGIITQRNIDIGSLIYGTVNGSTQELFQLAQTDTIRFFVDVPQTYYREIKDGLKADVTIPQLPDKVFTGKVTRFAKALNPIARTLRTEVDVENKDLLIYPGLFGRVTFLLYPDNINFIIPTTAIIIRSGYPHVAVVDDNQIVHLKQVQIGRDYGKNMEIISGLQENERIVTIPSDRIQEGVKVKVLSIEKDKGIKDKIG